MKVYISGKISGLERDDWNNRFNHAECNLRKKGFEVLNPAKITDSFPKDTTWQEYLWFDIDLLKMCDSIYMLNNWETSKGANLEKTIAEYMGMNVMFESEEA